MHNDMFNQAVEKAKEKNMKLIEKMINYETSTAEKLKLR